MAVTVLTSTPTVTRATPGTASGPVLAANAARASAVLKNVGTVAVFVNFDAPATTVKFQLDPGDTLEVRGYTGSVTGITASGTGDIRCIESVLT
jgi:hypothetical protein